MFKKIVFCIIALGILGIVSEVVAIPDSLNPKKFFKHFSSTPAATATLTFSKEGKRLYVYIYLQQEKNIPDSVKVIWTGPTNSICGDSEYSLHYSGLHYQTRAYRTVVLETQDGDPLTCAGDWKVNIVNAHNKEIASGIFTVKEEGVFDKAIENSPTIEDPQENETQTS